MEPMTTAVDYRLCVDYALSGLILIYSDLLHLLRCNYNLDSICHCTTERCAVGSAKNNNLKKKLFVKIWLT